MAAMVDSKDTVCAHAALDSGWLVNGPVGIAVLQRKSVRC
jgi:hypothetical protein